MHASREQMHGTAEAAIRCRDLAAMVAFYRDIMGLEVTESDAPKGAVELSAAEGFTGPVRRLVLYVAEDDDEPAPHHLTLTVAGAEALARAEAWLRANGLCPEIAEQAWAGWMCLTVSDPEGNTVELAAPVRQRTLPAKAPAGQG